MDAPFHGDGLGDSSVPLIERRLSNARSGVNTATPGERFSGQSPIRRRTRRRTFLTPVQGSAREANGHAVVATRDVPAGTLLTEMMVEVPRDSLLWRLRREQDEGFPGE